MAEWNLGDYTLADADAYFSAFSNPSHTIWSSFDEFQRESALREAEVKIWQFRRGKDLTPVSDYTGDERVRTDYAVYEQAFQDISQSHDIPNGERSGAKWISDASALRAEESDKVGHYIAPRAKNWLGMSLRNPIICRG